METTSSADSPEFHFSGLPEKRKKIDSFQPLETNNPQSIETAGDVFWQREEKGLLSNTNCDYRKSLAWDSAFFTSPGFLDHEELLETLNFRDSGNSVLEPGQENHKFLPSVIFELERTSKIGDCNVRRSLAWDSAFFTNPGVLDHEELSLVNKGYQKSERLKLPALSELWMSADSNSSVDSGSFAITSLEIDLFDDIRASSLKSSTTSDSSPLNHKSKQQDNQRLRNLDGSAIRRVKNLPYPRPRDTNRHGQEMIAKDTSPALQSRYGAQRRESKHLSSLKPPKTSRTPSSAPTKRAPFGSNHVEMGNTSSKPSYEHMGAIKKPCLRGTSSVSSRSAPTSKSQLSGLTNESVWSGCAPFDSDGKSFSNFIRRKGDSRLTSSDSASKTPWRNSRRSRKLPTTQQSPLFSTPVSSCTSPASSTDGWTSGSTNSCNQGSCSSTTSHDVDTFKGVFGTEDLTASNQYKTLLGTTCLATNVSRDLKSSGLRMPSPKLGFFDLGNSLALTPTGSLKFQSNAKSITGTDNSINGPNGGITNRRRSIKTRSAGGLTRTVHSPPPTKLEEVGKAASRSRLQTSSTFESSNRGGDMGASLKVERNEIQGHWKNKVDAKSEPKVVRRVKEVSSKQCKEKENVCSIENQVDTLSKHIEAISFNNREVVKEL